jgi:hypothetical protein
LSEIKASRLQPRTPSPAQPWLTPSRRNLRTGRQDQDRRQHALPADVPHRRRVRPPPREGRLHLHRKRFARCPARRRGADGEHH